MGDFSVAVEHVDGTVLLRPSGELDLAAAPQLERALDAVIGGRRAVLLDLSGLTFADCAGLAPIRRALREGAQDIDSLRLFAARPAVERVLYPTDLGNRVGRYSDAAGASPV